MRRIFKYPLNTEGAITKIKAPIVTVLKIKTQNGVPTVWIEIEEENEDMTLLVVSIGTGLRVSSNLQNWRYMGTEFENEFVWHFYGKVLSEEEEESDDVIRDAFAELMEDDDILWN